MNPLTTFAFWKMREMAFPSCLFFFSLQLWDSVGGHLQIPCTWQYAKAVWSACSWKQYLQDKKASNKTAPEIFKSVHLPCTVLFAIILNTNNISYPSPGASLGGYTLLRVLLSKSVSPFYITRTFPITFVHFELALLKYSGNKRSSGLDYLYYFKDIDYLQLESFDDHT